MEQVGRLVGCGIGASTATGCFGAASVRAWASLGRSSGLTNAENEFVYAAFGRKYVRLIRAQD